MNRDRIETNIVVGVIFLVIAAIFFEDKTPEPPETVNTASEYNAFCNASGSEWYDGSYKLKMEVCTYTVIAAYGKDKTTDFYFDKAEELKMCIDAAISPSPNGLSSLSTICELAVMCQMQLP